jgi:hypothetical protein
MSFKPPLWSSGQSSWLQIQRFGFDSRRYQIFWEVESQERGPLSFVSTIEELLERKSSGSGLENREYGRKDFSLWQRDIPLSANLALTSRTSGGRSVVIARWRTQATEFFNTSFQWPFAISCTVNVVQFTAIRTCKMKKWEVAGYISGSS